MSDATTKLLPAFDAIETREPLIFPDTPTPAVAEGLEMVAVSRAQWEALRAVVTEAEHMAGYDPGGPLEKALAKLCAVMGE